MQRILPSLRSRVFSSPLARRAYSTAPSSAASNTAPIFLGLGLLGAGGFYYSTLDAPRKGETVLRTAVQEVKEVVEKVRTTAALNKDEFREFKLAEIIPYNHNTSRFVFDLPEGTHSGLTVASALVVKSATEGEALGKNGKPAIRPYTPTTAPSLEGKLELLVKKYPEGVMSSHIHELKVGQSLAIKGPIPKFSYVPNEFEDIALIAGGSGITPMWQIMQEIAANPADKTKATLIFGNVTEEDILLRKEFEALATSKPDQFKIIFVLDKPTATWKGESGFISQKILAQNIPGPAYGERLKIFVCGPPAQVNAISGGKKSFADQGELKGVLADLGYVPSQVYKF